MAIQIKRTVYLSLVALNLTAFSAGSAYCQTPAQPKLTLGNVNFYNPTPDGFYTCNVGLSLERGSNNPQVGFNITMQHVRTLDEVYEKLKPEVDALANELKAAAEGFHPPH
jgi:hypothetical protein